ncbi:MAG: ArsI/CadI family heavy metal resistance metalloenzyme [Gammaproteobacteria bacterium]
MSRFHVHIAVDDLDRNVAFYSAVFGVDPSVVKADYAKWQLDDPRINFAISTRGRHPGLDHVGIQADSDAELAAVRQRLDAAGIQGLEQSATTCCYAESDKYWTVDPQGIAWETFHTLSEAPVFGESSEQAGDSGACCTPNLSGCCS